MMALLDFENQMFLELFQDDALVVVAKGLGIERLFINLIKTYNDPGNLVLVIGTTTAEEEYINNQLTDSGEAAIKTITAEVSTKDRYEVYMDGGVLFVSTRILVVDMLVERLPIDLVTGIIVFRAHKILESCQEAFIIRLYRIKNNKGFIKALSSSPCAFTRGFSQVQRVMRNLFVRNLYLWPRFHAVVASSIEKAKPEVIEMHVPMTQSMTSIQICLLDIMSACVKELKNINPSLDTDELTVENAVAKSFDKIIKYQLDPVWHQLSAKTKRLISDLKFLRSVLQNLTQQDCVTFYHQLKSIRENVNVDTQMSDWLFLDAAESLFVNAKERVIASNEKKKKGSKTLENNLKLEDNPKWSTLSDILCEISDEVKEFENQFVLIVVNNETISNQLHDILSEGNKAYLNSMFSKIKPISSSELPNSNDQVKKANKRKLKDDEQTLTQMTKEDDADDTNQLQRNKNIFEKCSNLTLEFYPLSNSIGNHFKFQSLCELYHPQYIILYDGDMEIIRRIEMYQAINFAKQIKVYFLVYSGSAEEQCYLTTLRREKEAFEFLIKEKAHMVLPEGIDGKTGDHPDLVRGSSLANETVNSRKAGGQTKPKEEQKVIVDMREFRSELPSLLHRRGIEVVPVTLEVGDYVLTPDLCVERKSVADLIGSLNSGRLYTQAQSMCRLYKHPVLLIEFDQNKAFSLQGKYYFNSWSTATQNITSKLILLTVHFPGLRILWCPSPYITAEMFELLKLKKPQPDEKQAMSLKTEGNDSEIAADKYNTVGCDFVSKLPGLNSKNMWPIMSKVKSIADLINYSEEDFIAMLDNSSAAKSLWTSINHEMKTTAPESSVIPKKPKKPWKAFKKA